MVNILDLRSCHEPSHGLGWQPCAGWETGNQGNR